MRIFFASDLHVDVPGNADFVRALADVAAADAPDVVIIAGDVCNGVRALGRTLASFAPAAPNRFYVPGNHELWATSDGEPEARERYYRELPSIARDAGFHPLITDSAIAGDVGFAGTMAWYDYSFADPQDGFSTDAIATKSHEGREWMDRRFVHWRDADGRAMPDPEVTALLLEDLAGQLDELAGAPVRQIILVTHHLAFREIVPPVFVDGHLKFFRSFLGATGFGALAAQDPRVTLALAGHVHSIRAAQHGAITVRTCPVGYPRERKTAGLPAERRLLLDV